MLAFCGTDKVTHRRKVAVRVSQKKLPRLEALAWGYAIEV